MAAPTYPAWLQRLAAGQKRALPMRPRRPLALANHVRSHRKAPAGAACLTEMMLMMVCWKQNEFNDAPCAKEVEMFYDCVAKADMEYKERLKQESLGQTENLPSEKVNELLRRFPNITHNF